MLELVITKKYNNDDEGTQTLYSLQDNGKEVGTASVINYTDGTALIERIDINEGQRNKGYGTHFIEMIAEMYDDTYLAADNEDCARLYNKIGTDASDDEVFGYLDLGFGVYRV